MILLLFDDATAHKVGVSLESFEKKKSAFLFSFFLYFCVVSAKAGDQPVHTL